MSRHKQGCLQDVTCDYIIREAGIQRGDAKGELTTIVVSVRDLRNLVRVSINHGLDSGVMKTEYRKEKNASHPQTLV